MSCSFRWVTVWLSITLSIWADTVVCQNNVQSGPKIAYQTENSNKEPYTANNVSTKSQLMNTLLTVAAANGVLPDLLPVIQPSLSNENYNYQSDKDVPKTLNLIQLSPNQYPRTQESMTYTQPTISTQSPVVATPVTTSMPVLQTTFTPSQTHHQLCPVSQVVRFENTPSTYSNSAIVQPIPAIWQHQPPNVFSEGWKPALSINNVTPEIRPSAANLQITPPSSYIESDNSNNSGDVTSRQASFVPNDSDPSLPVNLQINLPSQNLPAPQITVVSSAPPTRQTTDSYSPSFPPFFQPPIVVDRSDSLNHWLPMILVALFANEKDNYGGGCQCNCCCQCGGGSKSVIPIPYPIPYPMNSPVMNGNTRSKPNPYPRKHDKNNEDHDEEAHDN